MSRLHYRSASVCVAVVALCAPVHAEEPKLTAAMQCERAAEPGRVRCSVEARSTSDRSISWADVALVDLPDFTTALKGRIGPADATLKEATAQKWAFGLVAKKAGQGEARARVRALLCASTASGDAAAPRCAPVTVDVKATITVG